MKFLSVVLVVLLAPVARAQETDAPLRFEADGVTLQVGRSVKLAEGAPAPFTGRLTDEQEQVRRARVNTRNEVELAVLKKGNVVVSTPVFITIIVGVVAASAAATAGVLKATEKKP